MSIMSIMINVGDPSADNFISVPGSVHKAFNDKPVAFAHLAPNGAPIKRIDIDSEGNRVEYEDIISGYEYAPHKYVALSKSEMKALNSPPNPTVSVDHVVEISTIAPELFNTPYFLGINSRFDETHAYDQYKRLMSIVGNDNAAIGQAVMFQRDYVIAIYKSKTVECLMMSTLRYAENMRNPPLEITGVVAEAGPAVVGLSNNFDINDYTNHYGSRARDLIANKVAAVTGVTSNERKNVNV